MAPVGREHDEIAADLKATLAARRELGPEMDDELVELLLTRVDGYITSQVAGQVAHQNAHVRDRRRSRNDLSGFPPSLHPWRSFLMLAVFLLAGSIVFGAHVHAFPVVAMVILLAVFLSHRGCQGNRGARQL